MELIEPITFYPSSMNVLTSEMTRLCGEIAAMKDSRAVLMESIRTSNQELQNNVADLLGEFHKSRIEMADATHAELSEFTSKVKDSVTELRQHVMEFQTDLRTDLAGAHVAWFGEEKKPKVTPFRKKAPAPAPAPEPAPVFQAASAPEPEPAPEPEMVSEPEPEIRSTHYGSSSSSSRGKKKKG